jgi:hypothetical protein
MAHDYFSELEKIANELVSPEDLAADPMVEDPQPKLSPEAVEEIQAANSDVPTAAEEQLPTSPEDVASLEMALAEAEGDLQAAKEVLAQAEEAYADFEKIAFAISEELPGMGALARLIDFSTNENVDESIQKLAHERLTIALKDEDSYSEILTKTAQEIFEDEENVEQLYSREGLEYVTEHLASFAEDEELEKNAFELSGIVSKVRETAGEYVEATRKLHKIRDEIDAAKAEVDNLSNVVLQKNQALGEARKVGDPSLVSQMLQEQADASRAHLAADSNVDDLIGQRNKGAMVAGAGAGGLVGGAYFGGKKLFNANQNNQEEELSTKTASVTMNPEDTANYEGGKIEMSNSLVQDFLKIAGAAVLLDVANDENAEEGIRKEAAATFNAISRMGRKDMEESFVKVAQQMYNEDVLHSIVAGNYNEELFDKIAFFTSAYDMSADELEKVAGADGVAAKGVGGALTDAKANIVEKIEGDKVKTETVANGEIGTKKADDMRGYNVINSPGEYQVEKTASLIEEAEMRKVAAFNEFVAMDNFIRNNKK